MDGKSEELKKTISVLSKSDAELFSKTFDEKMDQAYSHKLWGAAYLIHGGCGDDTFTDFRASLVSRGKQAFESAITDPDSLSKETFDDEVWFYEGYQYAVTEGVEKAVGSEVYRQSPFPDEPSGESWEETPEYFKNAYPTLWEAFGKEWEVPEETIPLKASPWWKFW